uniref:TRAF3-interacting protein 1 n=1 Tax=Suricata suricatta TaxID=37032 RepID=A0A673T1B1_SURSU
MNAAVVKRTQEALGKVIRRPPLTEKLLSKPPFRYLHDIITEVIRVTGFMKGLYTDAEMKSDNVKDKDAKISFLQKAIDVVAMVSGEPLAARPARMVAGHEPERTNELLQRLGRCCLSKLSSEDAVKRVLAGERGDAKGRAPLPSRPQESDNRTSREEEPGLRKDKEDERNSEMNEENVSRDRKQKEEGTEESKARAKDKDQPKENDRERHKEPERDKYRDRESERARNRARPDRDRGPRERDRGAERESERRSEAGKEKDRGKDRERERDKGRRRGRDADHPRDPDREKGREHGRAERKSSSSGEVPKKLSDGSVKDSKAETETEVSTRASRSVATKTSKQRSKNSMEGDSPSDAEGEVGPSAQEGAELPGELPAGIRLPRPGSARPAPPRVKHQDSVEAPAADRTGSGKAVASVIVDAQNSDSEEDDQFVVEAAPRLPGTPELEAVPAVGVEDEEGHGGLVKKILETKKDYEKLQQPPRPGEKEKLLVSESAWKKEKDIVSKEIEKLRVSIQTLCRSALPLGKIMDYLQEDVDAMQNELQLWRSENKQHAEALQREQSITDCAVEPLKAELAELEQLIRDQQDKICAVKASVLRNEEKIQKLVRGIASSSRSAPLNCVIRPP